MSRADWCCKDDDDNRLWYKVDYPEGEWLAAGTQLGGAASL